MIDHTSIEFHNDRLKEIQSILDKLAPHEHGDGMNECHICDQELDEAILIELRKILERKEAVADDVEAALQKIAGTYANILDYEAIGKETWNQLLIFFACSEAYSVGMANAAGAHPLSPTPSPVERWTYKDSGMTVENCPIFKIFKGKFEIVSVVMESNADSLCRELNKLSLESRERGLTLVAIQDTLAQHEKMSFASFVNTIATHLEGATRFAKYVSPVSSVERDKKDSGDKGSAS